MQIRSKYQQSARELLKEKDKLYNYLLKNDDKVGLVDKLLIGDMAQTRYFMWYPTEGSEDFGKIKFRSLGKREASYEIDGRVEHGKWFWENKENPSVLRVNDTTTTFDKEGNLLREKTLEYLIDQTKMEVIKYETKQKDYPLSDDPIANGIKRLEYYGKDEILEVPGSAVHKEMIDRMVAKGIPGKSLVKDINLIPRDMKEAKEFLEKKGFKKAPTSCPPEEKRPIVEYELKHPDCESDICEACQIVVMNRETKAVSLYTVVYNRLRQTIVRLGDGKTYNDICWIQ